VAEEYSHWLRLNHNGVSQLKYPSRRSTRHFKSHALARALTTRPRHELQERTYTIHHIYNTSSTQYHAPTTANSSASTVHHHRCRCRTHTYTHYHPVNASVLERPTALYTLCFTHCNIKPAIPHHTSHTRHGLRRMSKERQH